jgi:lysophospholipase L1-like esterase
LKLHTRIFALAIAMALMALAPAAAQAKTAKKVKVAVALGDSLSTGVQPDKAGKNQNTGQGYTTLLARGSGAVLANFGCGGATSASVLDGSKKCDPKIADLPYKNRSKASSQMAAAEKFIKAKRKTVAYVTIDIGANDVASCAAGGKLDVACVTAGIARIKKNVPVIAKRLRAAAGKNVPIAGMTFYNPFLQQWFTNPGVAQATVGIAKTQVNDALIKIYKKQHIKIADVGTAFGTYKPFTQTTTYNGRAGVPVAVANICKFTWMCAPTPRGPNIHATKAGYKVIAKEFQRSLGKAAKK